MEPAAPRVSVLLPVFNGAATIEGAVRSILGQTFEDHELIVIDDGSRDETLNIVGRLAGGDRRIRLVAEEHRGLVGALNRGLELSRGVFLARMDADDIALPERFAQQVAYLQAHGDCVAVGSRILKVDANGRPRRKQPRVHEALSGDWCATSFPPRPPGLAHPTAMIRSGALRAIGGYRAAFPRGGEDRDLWWRLVEVGRLHELPVILLEYRMHEASVSRSRRDRILLATLRADLAAVARHVGLDDGSALAEADAHSGFEQVVDVFERLIGARYPVRTYAYYLVARERHWSLAGWRSRSDMLRTVFGHVTVEPIPAGKFALVAATLNGLLRTPRVAAGK